MIKSEIDLVLDPTIPWNEEMGLKIEMDKRRIHVDVLLTTE